MNRFDLNLSKVGFKNTFSFGFEKVFSPSQFDNLIKEKEEFRWLNQTNGSKILAYHFSDSKTFENNLSLEARGIAFSKEGDLISRPLHKFFNLGEKKYRIEDLESLPVVNVFEKLDGSMIATAFLDGDVLLRSKKSFESDVAKKAQDFLSKNSKLYDFSKRVASSGMTAIFEWTSPEERIVIPYEKTELSLLHVRDNLSGEYVMLDEKSEVFDWIKFYGVTVCPKLNVEVKNLKNSLENFGRIEGAILQLEGGDMVKMKLPWYLRIHKAISFLRERDVALLSLREQLDDVKGYLVDLGISLNEVEDVERRVKKDLISYIKEVDQIVSEGRREGLEPKQMAEKNRDNPLFGVIMSSYRRGVDNFDWKEWYEKTHIKNKYELKILTGQSLQNLLEEQ